jgi:hypothetical protein
VINLLPPQYKNELRNEEKWKIILNLEIFLFGFLIALTLILLSVKINVEGLDKAYLILNESGQKVIKLEKEHTQTLGVQNLKEEVKETNDNLSKLNSFFKEPPDLILTLGRISELLPPNSYLTDFSYQRDSNQIILSGFCENREVLFQLKKNLESQGDLKDFYFPSSNWLNPDNFKLSFKLEINDGK